MLKVWIFGGMIFMSRILLTNDELIGTTAVSNVFIDHYMKEANDAQIKVYLYLLRNAASHTSFEIGDIAEEFNHTEKDVIRALKYWEKAGLLTLRYDMTGEICGIGFIGSIVASSERKVSGAPVLAFVPKSEETGMISVASKVEEKTSETATVPAVPEKPAYSAEEIKAFRNEANTEELIAITESYLVKTISPSDLRSLLFIHKELGFDFEMIDLLLQYCVSKGKKSFNYIETIAVSWYEQGIKTAEQAKAGQSRFDKNIFDVMTALGKSKTPTAKEAEFITRWFVTYGFSKEMILYACEKTTMKTDTDRFPYAEGILKKWKEQGLTTKAAVDASEEEFRKSKRPAEKKNSTNSNNGYKKANYDFAALQKFVTDN